MAEVRSGQFRDFTNYRIYEDGRVESLNFGRSGRSGWMNTRANNSGYQSVDLRKDKVKYTFLVHRLVAETFIPNTENLSDVNHINADKSDNRVSNLEWVSHAQNMQHSFENNLLPYGERHGNARLTEGDVREIRQLLAEGVTNHREIGALFGISHSTVRDIEKGRRWRRLK